MGFYTGPAVVVDQDGNEHEVHANLRSRGEAWSGSLAGAAPWPEVFRSGAAATIRLHDRQGAVLAKSSSLGTTERPVPVVGSGAAPFD